MIYEYFEPWLDEWQTGGRLTVDHHNGVTTVLAWEPNKMPTFFDALSGEKRKLNINRKTFTPTPTQVNCDGEKWMHDFPNYTDETCKCIKCGASLLYVRALRNIDKPKY